MANVNPLKVFQIQNDLAQVVLQKFEANDIVFFQELETLVQKHTVPKSITENLARFGNIARSRGITLYYDTSTGTDPEILKWLSGVVVSLNLVPEGIWKKANNRSKSTSEGQMLKTALTMPLFQAIDMYITELLNGTFDTFGVCRIIFLKEKDVKDRALMLVCQRVGDGAHCGKLCLFIRRVDSINGWCNDFGWLEKK